MEDKENTVRYSESERHSGRLPLFEVQSLRYSYPDGHPALDGIDLAVFPGDRVALVGHNGAGKTTFIKHLNGLFRPHGGRVLYNGLPLEGAHLDAARLRIGMLFQDPDDQLFCNTLDEDVSFGPGNQGLSPSEIESRAVAALRKMNVEQFRHKMPHNLSYGQKKRAAFATVLSMEPEVLILDEPTANLDPKQERFFTEFLREFAGTLICISHDLPFLYCLCTRAVVLERGRVHHDFLMQDLVSHRAYLRDHGLDFTFRLTCCQGDDGARGDHDHHHHHGHDHHHDHGYDHHDDHHRDGDGRVHAADPSHVRSHVHIHTGASDMDASTDSRSHSHLHSDSRSELRSSSGAAPLRFYGGGDDGKTDRPGNDDGRPEKSLMLMRDYSFRYADGTWGIKQISLSVREGESVAIVGENGAGKSTLVSCLAGISEGTGEYRFDAMPVRGKYRKNLWRQIGIVFQDPADQLFNPSCREEVAFGPRQLRLPAGEVSDRVEEALSLVRLTGFENRVPHHMSAGERKRLALAAVIAMRPRVIILDEPTANLDPRSEELLCELLAGLDVTKILISHDIDIISMLCRRTVVVHKGKVVRDYSSSEFVLDEHLLSVNGLDYTFKNACSREILRLQGSAR